MLEFGNVEKGPEEPLTFPPRPPVPVPVVNPIPVIPQFGTLVSCCAFLLNDENDGKPIRKERN